MLELVEDRPRPAPIIVKRVIEGGGGHHGGAWKVAYADFVTAMMAFFLIMWILGATSEDQRKGIADYFRPTLATQSAGGGANGLLAGRSMNEKDGIAKSATTALASLRQPIDQIETFTDDNAATRTLARDLQSFESFRLKLLSIIESDPQLASMSEQMHLTLTPEGLRLEVTDAPGSAMFAVGETGAVNMARPILAGIATALAEIDNDIAVRGHTDGRGYASPQRMNNWLLSAARADATRQELLGGGVDPERIARIEGTADRELRASDDPLDERNRRISITMLFSDPNDPVPEGPFFREGGDAQ